MDEEIRYHLYGRTTYAQPLTFVRAVSTPAGERPLADAGEAWLELIAFPESAVVRVIPRPAPAEAS